jgi:4-hydroxy-3-polyprenylbenzoate decarboxylase
MRIHWRAALERGEDLPVAVVIGPSVQLMMAASAQIPYGMEGLDEYSLAGGFAGAPVKLVPAKTIPMDVPADAEVIIEGWISTRDMEPIYSFGEYPGYMRTEKNVTPTIRVTAITHRRDAIFTPITVGFYPSDSNTLLGFARAGLIYRHLKYVHALPVEEVYLPQEGSGIAICLLRMAAGASQEQVQAALRHATEVTHFKYAIAVDHDIRLEDPQQVFWALSYSTRPLADLVVEPGGGGGILDPSLAPAGAGHGDVSPATGIADSRVLINATRKFAYPPVGLPRQPYMERAVQLWNESPGLPKVELKTPWYGYTLGYWPEELQQAADHIAAGNYRAVGAMAAQQRVAATQTKATAQEHVDAPPSGSGM